MFKVENIKTAERLEVERLEQVANQIKIEKSAQLATLTVVTSNGNIFDANNQARLDMGDGIKASETTKQLIDLGLMPADTVWDKTVWKLADDSEVLIDILELKEASLLAIKEYARIKGIGNVQ